MMFAPRVAVALSRRLVSCAALSLLVVLLAGCAEQQIRKASQESLNQGDYEAAVRQLEAGVQQYPESTLLRSGLLQARAEVMARTLATAAALRAQGQLESAAQTLAKAKQLDPQNPRVDALLADLDTLRRQEAALTEAEALAAQDQPAAALRTIERALKHNPRHAGLAALQRKLELTLRDAGAGGAEIVLAETRPISLDFRDASLRTVLDVVSRHSGINFILDRDIRAEERITVFLRQARVEDALDLIVSTGQLAKKVVDPTTIVIYPHTPDKQRQYQEQIVRVFYLASADAKGAAAFLRAMLKIGEPFVDERSNMLSLRDTQENIRLAERLIALYDAGEPEVLLEVEVLEVSSTRLTELGVKFPDTFSLTPLAPAGASGLTLGNVGDIGRDRIGLGIAGLLINLRREVGDFTTLANPRIRVRNKEQAKILIGDKIPVITTTTGTGGFVSDSVNYLDVGLKLDVEPTIYADDEVAIKIALEVSSLGSSVKTSSGTLAYQIGTRNAATLLRLRDGETQLLAGLISKDDRTSASRVPGVGDLPVLGRLFSSQLDSGQRTELVLAITPRILRSARAPAANETELWVGTDAQPRLRRPVPPVARGAPAPAAVAPTEEVTAAPSAEESPAPSTSQPVSFKWGGTAQADVGQTAEVVLTLKSGIALRGAPMNIGYDRQRLQLVDVTEGAFFSRGGAATSFTHSVDADTGKLRVGVLRNQANGAEGEDTVLTLRFKVLAPGAASVRLESAQPVRLGPEPIVVAPTPPWTVQVQ